MGLIEDMMGSFSGADEAIHPHLVDVLQALTGDEEEPGPGLEGLLTKLRTDGLGGIVDSWNGGATNLPVSPDQLREALGEDEVQTMARRSGLPAETMLEILAEHLPGLIDRLSPQGNTLPAGASSTSKF